MKRIMQFRYEGQNSLENYPNDLSNYRDQLINGNIFKNYSSVSQFGIQGPPGLKFILNNSQYPITIGDTGIYELDLENVGRIFSIRFLEQEENGIPKEGTLDYYYPEESPGINRLLIDIVYEGV